MRSHSSKLVAAGLATTSLALFPVGAGAANSLQAEQRAAQAAEAAQRSSNGLHEELQSAQAAEAAQHPAAVQSLPAASTSNSSRSSGFDWGDAGIGAGGAVVLLLGLGGTFAVTHRNGRDPKRPGRSTLAS